MKFTFLTVLISLAMVALTVRLTILSTMAFKRGTRQTALFLLLALLTLDLIELTARYLHS